MEPTSDPDNTHVSSSACDMLYCGVSAPLRNASEDGKSEVLDKPQPPEVVATGQEGVGNNENELDQYSANVQKRIDKLTARLRETQRREQAALEYAKSVQERAQQLEQRYQQSNVCSRKNMRK